MKKIIVLIITFFAGSQMAISQNHTNGGHFEKRIEYNLLLSGTYNFMNKSIYERIFFGQTNSFVEFFFEDPTIASAFRIIRDSQKESYRMEVMQIPDTYKYYSLVRDLSAGINTVNIPQELQSQIPLSVMAVIHQYNKKINYIYIDSLLKPHRPKPKKYKVSKAFAEKLYEKMTSLIDSFKAEGIPPLIADGATVSFRTIVGDEVWSLKIHVPQGTARRMSDLCRQIITDADTRKPDEAKYMELLEKIDFGNRPQ